MIFVVGHFCSEASIPASAIYEAAGVLMISPGSSNPMLTELGRANVFRLENRDDEVGKLIANCLADHWSDKKIARARAHGTAGARPVQLLTGQSLGTEEFALIAGPAAEGKTLYTYAAVQVWAQAAKKAGSLKLQAVIASLWRHQFDTVLGPIDFDKKGDLAVQNPVWWVWRGGKYMPLEPSH